jgi:hypothetical protein
MTESLKQACDKLDRERSAIVRANPDRRKLRFRREDVPSSS